MRRGLLAYKNVRLLQKQYLCTSYQGSQMAIETYRYRTVFFYFYFKRYFTNVLSPHYGHVVIFRWSLYVNNSYLLLFIIYFFRTHAFFAYLLRFEYTHKTVMLLILPWSSTRVICLIFLLLYCTNISATSWRCIIVY